MEIGEGDWKRSKIDDITMQTPGNWVTLSSGGLDRWNFTIQMHKYRLIKSIIIGKNIQSKEVASNLMKKVLVVVLCPLLIQLLLLLLFLLPFRDGLEGSR